MAEVDTSINLSMDCENDCEQQQEIFRIDMSQIPKITQEENSDLASLGIEAYNLEILEERIVHQVDEALKKQNKITTDADAASSGLMKESELDKGIRMGEVTPFGTMLNASSNNNDISCLESYFKRQDELSKSAEVKKMSKVRKIVFPKKRKRTMKLGTFESSDHFKYDQGQNNSLPAESEKTAFPDSDSEYIPDSDSDETDEGVAATSHVKMRPVKVKKRKDSNSEAWKTDDSDWEDSNDDDENMSKRKRQTVVDDGNIDDYLKRIELSEKSDGGDAFYGEVSCKELTQEFKVPSIIWEKLYRYQKVGIQWLWELHNQRCGGILGDEMGLGKTIQVIGFLAGLRVSKLVSRFGQYRGLGPVLIVCPTTLMSQWVAELHHWWPPFRVALVHISGSFHGPRKKLIHEMAANNGIVITSYAGCVKEIDSLLRYKWHYVLLDEGHKIRNPDSQITATVKMFATPHRIILSGSPMQNNLRELWSLFDFIFPGKLGTLPVFMAEFAVPITQGGYANATQIQVATAYKCATVLRDTISPYLLRRVKADVQSHINLPGKNEQVLFCKLTGEQKSLYQSYLSSGAVDRILEGHCKIFVGLITLRKICNHPDLYSGSSKLLKEEVLDEKERFGYWEKSGKMIVVKSLLELWKKQGHRVLLFTQSRQMLQILEQFLISVGGYNYLKMDGSTTIASRQPLIQKFNTDESYFVFLATTRVGGLGVNLTGASRVIIYDPDWNPATDTQARERAWRIGQKNQVTIYRLITAGTIEEKIYHRQIFKQFLTNKVLKDPRQRRFFKSNDLYELFTLKDSDETTETSAIFAGTGSEVNLHNLDYQQRRMRKLKEDAPEIAKPVKVQLSAEQIQKMRSLAQTLSRKIAQGDLPPSTESKDHRKKIKRKTRRRDVAAKIDGEEVPHLVRQSVYQEDASVAAANDHVKQDEYILKKLLSKASVQTALRHDKIIEEEGSSDYAIVEAEAEKVAKEAVKALKESRRSYQTTTSDSVACSNGFTRIQGKRFGCRNGNKAGLKNRQEPVMARNDMQRQQMSSDELLARIHNRNRLIAGNDQAAENTPHHNHQTPLDEHSELLTDIRNFIAYGAAMLSCATTREILDKFQDRLPAGQSPLFKALLYEICEFYRTSTGEGVWRLRPEFAW